MTDTATLAGLPNRLAAMTPAKGARNRAGRLDHRPSHPASDPPMRIPADNQSGNPGPRTVVGPAPPPRALGRSQTFRGRPSGGLGLGNHRGTVRLYLRSLTLPRNSTTGNNST